jgi:hypothetical protein
MAADRLLTTSRRRLMAVTTLIAALLLGLPPLAGWNQVTHRQINFEATKLFFSRAAKEQKFQWGPVSDAGRTARLLGIAVDGSSATIEDYRLTEERHTMVAWITLGGDWADEPNLYASLRHFYDPLQVNGVAYLTDQYAIHGNVYESPETDAVTWALEDPDNPFCFKAGLIAYKHAMETPEGFQPTSSFTPTHFKTNLEIIAKDAADQRSLDLAHAYRSLGEAMHLIGDMTQPAHVRNDSHPLDEPIEQATFSGQVRQAAANPLVDPRAQTFLESAGGALQTPRVLFRRLALFTNHTFYSMDTIYDEDSGTIPNNFQPPLNMMHPYPSPQFDELTAHTATIHIGRDTRKVKRLFAKVAGREVPIAQERLSMQWFDPDHTLMPGDMEELKQRVGRIGMGAGTYSRLGPYMIPSAFAREQSAVLLPLAIHAGADLMNLFFPTLELRAEYRDEGLQSAIGGTAEGQRRVIAIEPEMVHHRDSDPAWKAYDLKIRYSGPGTLVITRGKTIEATRKLEYEDGRLTRIEHSDGSMITAPLQVYVAGGDSPLRDEEAFYAFEFGQQLHLEIDAGSRHFESPTYEIAVRLSVEPPMAAGPPGTAFEFDAHAHPKGHYRFEWMWTGSGGPVVTEGPSSTVAPVLTEEGEYTFTVRLLYPDGRVLAEEQVFATVEDFEDEKEPPTPTPRPSPTPRRERGRWVLSKTTLIDGCSFYESECYTLETCDASPGSFNITKSYSSCGCSTCGGESGSGSYTVPPASLVPGETVILRADATGDGSSSVSVRFYEDSKGLTFDDRGHASHAASWTLDIARSSSSSIPNEGEFTVPTGLNRNGTLQIIGAGNIGAFEMSMSYSFLYQWQE